MIFNKETRVCHQLNQRVTLKDSCAHNTDIVIFSSLIDAVKLHLMTSIALKIFTLELICSWWCPSDLSLTKKKKDRNRSSIKLIQINTCHLPRIWPKKGPQLLSMLGGSKSSRFNVCYIFGEACGCFLFISIDPRTMNTKCILTYSQTAAQPQIFSASD